MMVERGTMTDAVNYQETCLRILVIGDRKVGKTSIIKQYVEDRFNDFYKTTIGVEYYIKDIKWDAYTKVQLCLLDIQGQENTRNMTRSYYKGADGCLIVFDTDSGNTFEGATIWKKDLDAKVFDGDSERSIPAVLLENKCDEPKHTEDHVKTMNRYCHENNFLLWFEVSAKKDRNIDEAVRFLVKAILDSKPSPRLIAEDTVNLSVPYTLNKKKSCCFSSRK